MSDNPGGALAKRPLQFMWIVDCSGSMQGKKMATLNLAIKETIQPMRDVAKGNPNADVLVRVVKFSDGAQWHISKPTPIEEFKWTDLEADGVTDLGKALTLAAEALKTENMPPRGLPPVLVLISDGQPTDDFAGGLKALMDQPWGMKAVRIGVAIGEDADLDVMQKFIANSEVKPLVSTNVQDLVNKIKWASTVPLKQASNPASRTPGKNDNGGANIAIPAPPPNQPPIAPGDVF